MIRKYRASDFSDIAVIFDVCKKDEFAGEPFTIHAKPLVDDKKMQGILNESDLYVYQKEKVVGFIGHKYNHISWLFVHPDYRQEKIGTELVSFVLSRLKGEVTLNVARSNRVAYHLYERLGFRTIKEFTGTYQTYPLVIWKMCLVL